MSFGGIAGIRGTVGTLVVVVVVVVAGSGVVTGGSSPKFSGYQAVGVNADIDYTCRNVTVTVEPKWVQYDLVVFYEDTVTGKQGKALLGPMRGRTVEPYGNGIVFTSVEVVVNGATVETETILARCYPDTSDAMRSERSAIGTESGVSVREARSRNPVPVATATTDSSGPISPAFESRRMPASVVAEAGSTQRPARRAN
jgi:hypothetical protein